MPVDSSKELALFLEKMRFLRGISQEDFTDGIISNRQYQRYVRGESPMPYHLIDPFAERLNVKKDVLLLEFDNHTLKETLSIVNYFSAVANKDVEQITELKSKIDSNYIIDPDNRKTYRFTHLLENYLFKKISVDVFKRGITEIIDYPKILSQSAMSSLEVLTLSQMLEIVSPEEQMIIAKKIGGFLENPDLVWSGNQIITFNVIIFRLAKFYGVEKDYKNVINYCKLGIKFNTRAKSYNNLDYYYYFLALAYFRLDSIDVYKDNLYKCYSALVVNNSPSRIKLFTEWIEKDFNINYKEFIIDYLKDKPGL